jgi:hypothetical protein
MSEWPKRYDTEVDRDGVIIGMTDEVMDGDLMMYEDFERLLNWVACKYCTESDYVDMSFEQIKEAIIEVVRTDIPGV